MDVTESVAEQTLASATTQRTHVAVVFFHGIGQQRNYENTAHLIESLDEWVFDQSRARASGFDVAPRLRSYSQPCGTPVDSRRRYGVTPAPVGGRSR